MPRKIPPKYWMYGAAVVVPIAQYAFKSLLRAFATPPRHCPKCSYQTVAEVGRRRAGAERIVHYWRCSACATRYRSYDDGPLSSAPEKDWAEHVRFRFAR